MKHFSFVMSLALSVVFTSVWYFLSAYLFMPTIAITASSGIYFNLICYFTIIGLIWLIKFDKKNNFPGIAVPSLGVAVVLFMMVTTISLYSSEIFHADSYRNLIGTIDSSEFNAHVQPIPTDQMLIVDEEIAERVGEKLLGSDPGLGSRVRLGNFTLQPVAGKLYWIAPLVHSGFFRWWKFSDKGTPGYVRVSATNQEDYALITKDSKGNELNIRYQPQSFLDQNLSRLIYNNYPSSLYTDLTFEVDDNWDPYWTITLYDTKIGFDGDDALGVITVDPMSGISRMYSIKDAPLWTERIQPADFIHDQINDWGNLVHGWLNPAKADKLSVIDDYSLVLGSDQRLYLYFGLTSHGKENSTVGFVMVDTRTKKAHWFKQAGATESAAQQSALGKFPEKGYVPSDGITYNISGRATYEFLLKDAAGLMKMVSLVNVHDHTIVGIGESRQEAMRDYEAELYNRGNALVINKSGMEIQEATSTISRFGSENIKGATYYYFTLANKPKTMFFATSGVSTTLPLTKEGDQVTIQYISSSISTISVMGFKNSTLGISDLADEAKKAEIDSIRIKNISLENVKVIEQKWENLSTEEKKKLLSK